MRTSACLILAALVALAPACKEKETTATRQDESAAVRADASAAPAKSSSARERIVPFLWKVTSKTARPTQKPTYLFGTFHANITPADIPSLVWTALDRSDVYVMEADQMKMDRDAIRKMITLPPGRSLDEELPADKWNKLLAVLEQPAELVKRQQPWFVTLSIGLKFFTVGVPIDMSMRARAFKAGKQIEFLESWRAALDILAAESKAKDLIELLDDLPKAREMAKKLLAAYRAGDTDKLIAAAFDPEEMKKQPKLFEGLLFARNRAWLPKIKEYVDRGGAFVAVGAGHIVGPKGLLDLLGKSGYRAERLAK